MPHYRQSSKNYTVLIQHPFIGAPPLFLSPSLQAYVGEEVFPANIGDDNNQPIDNLAIEVVALHHQQELANAQQVPDLEAQPPSAVAVDESLIANHRGDILLSKLILSIAVYFCPTFIVKPMTPLRFRMTIPIILHLACAFVALVLVILLIIDPMLPVRLLFPF